MVMEVEVLDEAFGRAEPMQVYKQYCMLLLWWYKVLVIGVIHKCLLG